MGSEDEEADEEEEAYQNDEDNALGSLGVTVSERAEAVGRADEDEEDEEDEGADEASLDEFSGKEGNVWFPTRVA